jgi:uncharacterized integral membrane protein
MKSKLVLIAALFVLLAIVFLQNPGEVVYRIYFWKISLSQMILLPLTLLAGFFLGFAVARLRRRRP